FVRIVEAHIHPRRSRGDHVERDAVARVRAEVWVEVGTRSNGGDQGRRVGRHREPVDALVPDIGRWEEGAGGGGRRRRLCSRRRAGAWPRGGWRRWPGAWPRGGSRGRPRGGGGGGGD